MDNDSGVMPYINNGIVKTAEEPRENIRRIRVLAVGCQRKSFSGAACFQNLASMENVPLEIGWRFVPEHNGKGYAAEAAKAITDFVAAQTGTTCLMAVATPENIPSQSVMPGSGMTDKAKEQHYKVPCIVYELNIDDAG